MARRGELSGRTLIAQSAAGATTSINLPVESSVSPAVGDLVVYTRYSGASGSEVRLLNAATGCDIRLAIPAEIVRSAVLDPPGTAAYVHSVTRASRADAGVTRFDLSTGATTTVVPPLRPSEAFGPIFGTELRWSTDGAALAVQSCGFVECLTRVLDVGSGVLRSYDDPGQGAVIGVTQQHLVTFGACLGLPCTVLSADLITGDVATLAQEAFATSMDVFGVLTIETAAGQMEVAQ